MTDIEQIKKRITEIRTLANEILASEDAKPFRGYMMSTFVRYQIDEDGDEGYQLTIDECSPTDYDTQAFLAEKLREKGITEPLEITSEW